MTTISSIALLTVALAGCDDTSTFTIGLSEVACEQSIPTACDKAARCTVDTDHYLSGDLPGSQRFIVRTEGVATIKFEVLLTNERTPGSQFLLTVYEPNCADEQTYDSGGRNIFGLADVNGELDIPLSVMLGGDHLVEFTSDAYCAYTLKIEIAGGS